MRLLRIAVASISLTWMAACSFGTILQPAVDPSQFFVLAPMDVSERGVPITYNGTAGPRDLEIGLGPTKLPAYLARPEMVTQTSANQVDISEINRWAEPLDKNFVGVLAQNLNTLIGARVTTFPWYRPTPLDYQITIDITRFDTDSKGTARVIGRWEIKDPDSGFVMNSGRFDITDPAQPRENAAATLSRALSEVSVQLADAVRATKPPAPHAKTS